MKLFFQRALAAVSSLVLLCGAGLTLAGTVGAWAQTTLFHNIYVSLPGFLFMSGGLCLTVALLVFLGARRWPLLCLFGALLILMQTRQAVHEIPPYIKHQLIGAQMAVFPLNRLLNQARIPDIEVATWNVPNPQLLGPGLEWTTKGGWLVLLGALLGLPSDPALVWTLTRTIRIRCRVCGARWLRARHAHFCPVCATPTHANTPRLCSRCATPAASKDTYCIACGTALIPSYTQELVPPQTLA